MPCRLRFIHKAQGAGVSSILWILAPLKSHPKVGNTQPAPFTLRPSHWRVCEVPQPVEISNHEES